MRCGVAGRGGLNIGEGDDDAGRVGEEEDVVLHGSSILELEFRYKSVKRGAETSPVWPSW